jgi:hypothetical protein
LRRLADLHHRTRKCPAGVRVDGEACHLAQPNSSDVRLIDIRVHFHLTEILRDGEQRRRFETRRDGLAAVDITPDHYAIDRGGNHGAREINPRLVQFCGLLPFSRFCVEQVGVSHQLACLGSDNRFLGNFYLGIGCAEARRSRLIRCRCLIDMGGCEGLGPCQNLLAPQVALGFHQLRPCALDPGFSDLEAAAFGGEVGSRRVQSRALRQDLSSGHFKGGVGFMHFRLEGARIQLGERLSLPHFVIEVDQQISNLPGKLRADLNGHEGF